jgi:hypothetical protein
MTDPHRYFFVAASVVVRFCTVAVYGRTDGTYNPTLIHNRRRVLPRMLELSTQHVAQVA